VNCICGCGRKLGSGGVELNLLAGEVAIELVVWDKARSLRSPVATEEIESMLDTGAPRYQSLLDAIHAGAGLGEEERDLVDGWLAESRAARRRLAESVPALPKKKVKLSQPEMDRIDRLHPELTFTGAHGFAPGSAPPAPAPPVEVDPDPELDALVAAAEDWDYERLAVAWLGRMIASRQLSLDETRWLLGRLEDLRSGRRDEAEPALRRFLSERA
jgi:hypothetical protein